MKPSTSKFFAQFAAGIFGGTIFGIAAFLTMINYGGNYGCWAIIDSIFGTAGYESCGSFGAITGMITGAIVSLVLISRVKIINYSKVATYLLLWSFVLPFLYGVVTFWPPFQDADMLIVPPFILIFMLFSAIPSLTITGIMHWLKK